jgi:hypothetical protein
MYDHRTKTKWNHSTGRALAGPLAGRRLEILPSRLYRWKNWKNQHPDSRVLLGTKRQGFMGEFVAEREPENLGISTGRGPRATLYPYKTLLEHEVLNDTVLGKPVLASIDPNSHQTAIFSREVGNRILTFHPVETANSDEPLMRDTETKTLWHRGTVRALSGPLEGKKLDREVAVTWRIERWIDIYDQGTIYGKDQTP